MITLREYEAVRDASAVAALLNQARPETFTADDLIGAAAMAPPDRVGMAVLTADDLGFAEVYHDSWQPAGEFHAGVLVAPHARGQGIGSRLLCEVEDFAAAHGGRCVAFNWVYDAQPAGAEFARRRGYQVDRHVYESTLDPSDVDDTVLDAPDPAGVTVTSLAALGDTEANRRRLYELNVRLAPDDPGHPGTPPPPYEVFAAHIFGATWFRPESQFIAQVDGDWAALASVGYFATSNSLYHMFTGVDRRHRQRGIATALKRATIRHARAVGAAVLRTNNDSRNTTMISVNGRFGYRPQPGYFVVSRTISDTAGVGERMS